MFVHGQLKPPHTLLISNLYLLLCFAIKGTGYGTKRPGWARTEHGVTRRDPREREEREEDVGGAWAAGASAILNVLVFI